jgi:hypothetical protein
MRRPLLTAVLLLLSTGAVGWVSNVRPRTARRVRGANATRDRPPDPRTDNQLVFATGVWSAGGWW